MFILIKRYFYINKGIIYRLRLLQVARVVAKSKAYSPCHITGFYHKVVDHTSQLKSGSIGAGVSLSDGVLTTVVIYGNVPSRSFDISINGTVADDAIVSKKVLSDYFNLISKPCHVSISHETKIPIGFGLGSSGAASLSLSYGLNEAFGTNLSPLACAQVAHCAELSCKTGLGTVISEFIGGLEIRTIAGAPGVGKIETVPLEKMSIVSVCLGPLNTARCLDVQNDSLTEIAIKFIKALLKSTTVDNFLRLSFEFTEGLGVIKGTCKSIINLLTSNGFFSSLALFGETVFTVVRDEEVKFVLQLLEAYAPYCIVSKVDNTGARILKNSKIG